MWYCRYCASHECISCYIEFQELHKKYNITSLQYSSISAARRRNKMPIEPLTIKDIKSVLDKIRTQ